MLAWIDGVWLLQQKKMMTLEGNDRLRCRDVCPNVLFLVHSGFWDCCYRSPVSPNRVISMLSVLQHYHQYSVLSTQQ